MLLNCTNQGRTLIHVDSIFENEQTEIDFLWDLLSRERGGISQVATASSSINLENYQERDAWLEPPLVLLHDSDANDSAGEVL
jgi:hypothetical protein